jgi:hypothetical protein
VIHAKLDVDICDHPRALAAGVAAFGLWSWGLAYTRKHELDGELPLLAVRSAFGGGAANDDLAETLCRVGLWEKTEAGWRMLNYASKNETKAVIAQRRAAEQKKKDAWRGKRAAPQPTTTLSTRDNPVDKPVDTPRDNTRDNPGVSRGCPDSDSDSDSDLRSEEGSESQAARPRASGAAGFAADSWCDGVRSVTGGWPTLAPWERTAIEDHARDRPPDMNPSEWGHADGAAFAKRQKASKPPQRVTAKAYLEWVGDGREGPYERPNPLAKPEPAPAPYHSEADARDWLRGKPPPKGDVEAGAAEALAALGRVGSGGR